ncbi:hypothetical protein GCM10028778_27400 [Barrientosiimonas marina]
MSHWDRKAGQLSFRFSFSCPRLIRRVYLENEMVHMAGMSPFINVNVYEPYTENIMFKKYRRVS